ncbi:hypothetical protein FTUN_5373 [Frigoriglobus tundricola]|uniref:Uncharacterized protein n=1 Tax=Frigoriglobus tundricola TaxID=2774151 RepID=A0A6M5YX52_9BACT|nr:hypothetical protein FTUN_5373 [Frigoriglobus tundricola]
MWGGAANRPRDHAISIQAGIEDMVASRAIEVKHELGNLSE